MYSYICSYNRNLPTRAHEKSQRTGSRPMHMGEWVGLLSTEHFRTERYPRCKITTRRWTIPCLAYTHLRWCTLEEIVLLCHRWLRIPTHREVSMGAAVRLIKTMMTMTTTTTTFQRAPRPRWLCLLISKKEQNTKHPLMNQWTASIAASGC